jgi:Cu/Ag efflux protein CusF
MQFMRRMVAVFFVVVPAFAAHAQNPSAQAAGKSAAAPTAGAALTNGEIVNVHPKEGKMLLKHGPIPNIGMGAMTMEFGLKDRKAFRKFKKGDKVRFAADRVDGEYVVTHIEAAD